MADDIKKDRDNKDQESGRPVQLDREEQGGKMGQQGKDKQHDKQGGEHGQKPGQPSQNR